MSKSARIEVRTAPEFKARVEARASELGQSLTVFVERALEKALEGVSGGSTPQPSRVPGSASPASPRASQEQRRW